MPDEPQSSAPAAESGAERWRKRTLFAIDLVTKIGGAAGAYLGVAAILMWPPFSGGPEVEINIGASRVNAPGRDRAADEFVCLVNKGDDVDLLNWVLRDAEGDVNVLPDITLASDQSIRVHPGRGADSETDVYGDEGNPQWNNSGDTITLSDDEGEVVASLAYGQASEDRPVDCE